MAGQGAAKRANAKRSKAKRERKKATERPAKAQDAVLIPTVNEDDLLAFQISHFADDTKPELWFVPAETAVNYDPALEEEQEEQNDDGLGYYEDGAKRTLTDEQIEMFRHSEREMMLREERLRNELNENSPEDVETLGAVDPMKEDHRPRSAASDVSSMEDDLLGLAGSTPLAPLPTAEVTAPSQSSRSEASSSLSTNAKRRPRKREIPYDERHKRKWEDYIEENDPVEGSLTHRRIVREMDQFHDTSVDLDY